LTNYKIILYFFLKNKRKTLWKKRSSEFSFENFIKDPENFINPDAFFGNYQKF